MEGRIQVRTYENENGARKWATEVVAKNIKLLGGAVKEQAAGVRRRRQLMMFPAAEELPGEESDLPF